MTVTLRIQAEHPGLRPVVSEQIIIEAVTGSAGASLEDRVLGGSFEPMIGATGVLEVDLEPVDVHGEPIVYRVTVGGEVRHLDLSEAAEDATVDWSDDAYLVVDTSELPPSWTPVVGPAGPAGAAGPQGDPGVVAATGLATYDDQTQTIDVTATAADVGADPAGSAAAVAGDLATHEGLTTTAHGGIVASTDPRLTDARTPTAHEASHHHDGSDPLDAGDVGAVPVEAVGLLPGETNRGTWDIAATYAVGDVVFETGSDLYIATAPSTGDQPSLTPGSWDVLDPTGRHVRLGPGATSGDYGTAVGPSATSGDYGTAVGPSATSGDFGTAVGLSATSGDYGTAVGPGATAGDYEVNVANTYRATLDPGDPTVPTGATIATGFVDLPETADVTNPPADHQRLVARTDGLYVRDETGAEVGPLGAGGAVEPGMVPPVSPSAYDQEYWDMADGSPVVGTWHNQGTSTAAISDGRLLMTCQAAASGYNQRALLTTLPSFTSVSTRITVGGELTNHSNAGLVLYNSGTGRLLQWLVHLHGPGKDLELHRANSFTSFDSATTTTGVPVGVGHVYLRITSDGTNIQRWVSADGDRWIMVGSVTLASWIGSVTGAGVVVGQEHAGIAVTASFDFLRFT